MRLGDLRRRRGGGARTSRFAVAPHASALRARWSHRPAGRTATSPCARRAAFPPNRHFFAPIKDLERDRRAVEHAIAATADGLAVRLRADAYAYFVHVAVPDERARFSDNFVELEPGEERTVAVRGADDLTVRTR